MDVPLLAEDQCEPLKIKNIRVYSPDFWGVPSNRRGDLFDGRVNNMAGLSIRVGTKPEIPGNVA